MKSASMLGLCMMMLMACSNSTPESENARSSQMNQPADTLVSPLQIEVQSIAGDSTRLANLGGKAYLVVNVASECGYTPQYEGLEALYDQYKDSGLVVVGFPCNQFGSQEPGSNSQILEFCRSRFDVSFPMMSKIEVNGDGQHPLYRYLTRNIAYPGDIKWNFTKFLLDSNGRVVARFEPKVEPLSDEVKTAVLKLL
jgi:glutathione peroxidase